MAMSFAQAMEQVMFGYKVRRADWHHPAFIHRTVVTEGTSGVGKCFSQIAMTMNDGSMNAYSPSQGDMFAYDWHVV
jgi:hypothetical protein